MSKRARDAFEEFKETQLFGNNIDLRHLAAHLKGARIHSEFGYSFYQGDSGTRVYLHEELWKHVSGETIPDGHLLIRTEDFENLGSDLRNFWLRDGEGISFSEMMDEMREAASRGWVQRCPSGHWEYTQTFIDRCNSDGREPDLYYFKFHRKRAYFPGEIWKDRLREATIRLEKVMSTIARHIDLKQTTLTYSDKIDALEALTELQQTENHLRGIFATFHGHKEFDHPKGETYLGGNRYIYFQPYGATSDAFQKVVPLNGLYRFQCVECDMPIGLRLGAPEVRPYDMFNYECPHCKAWFFIYFLDEVTVARGFNGIGIPRPSDTLRAINLLDEKGDPVSPEPAQDGPIFTIGSSSNPKQPGTYSSYDREKYL